MKRLVLFAAALAVSGNVWAGDAAAGKEKAKVCAACHGENGISAVADFPKLAGQHYDYLVRVMGDYKSGARKNAVMAGFAARRQTRIIFFWARGTSSISI